MFAAELRERPHITRRRDYDADIPSDRLDDHRRHLFRRKVEREGLFYLFEAGERAGGGFFLPWTAAALRVGEMVEARQHRADAAPHVEADRRGRQRAVGAAVIGRLKGDDLAASRVFARELYRSVYGVGTGESVGDLFRKISRRYGDQFFREFHGRFFIHIADGVAEQLFRLFFYSGDDTRMAGAGVQRGGACREVDIFVAVGVFQQGSGAGGGGERIIWRA